MKTMLEVMFASDRDYFVGAAVAMFLVIGLFFIRYRFFMSSKDFYRKQPLVPLAETETWDTEGTAELSCQRILGEMWLRHMGTDEFQKTGRLTEFTFLILGSNQRGVPHVIWVEVSCAGTIKWARLYHLAKLTVVHADVLQVVYRKMKALGFQVTFTQAEGLSRDRDFVVVDSLEFIQLDIRFARFVLRTQRAQAAV